jgi:hypothetical protein
MFASASGDPVWSVTTPLIAAVVTPCPDDTAGTQRPTHNSNRRFTRSSLSTPMRGATPPQEVYKGAGELAPEVKGGKGR